MADHETAIRAAAAAVAAAERQLEQAKLTRNVEMEKARADGTTWRAIATAAGMTEHGVRKALGYRRTGSR